MHRGTGFARNRNGSGPARGTDMTYDRGEDLPGMVE